MAEKNDYVNRELSWIEFNYRVLSEARDKSIPLFDRLKFLSITASNLDEFYMVRVASLKDMVHAKYAKILIITELFCHFFFIQQGVFVIRQFRITDPKSLCFTHEITYTTKIVAKLRHVICSDNHNSIGAKVILGPFNFYI